MRTTGGQPSSRETALAMIAQVDRHAAAISRRHANDEAILDSFTEFRSFIEQLGEFHLFLDMVGSRLRSIEADERIAKVRKLALIRWTMMEMEVEVSSQFLDRMVTSGKPWPMGSQKFLRRRLTRLEDISEFHVAHGAEYELTPPNVALMENIRARVDAQIDKSVPLADFGTVPVPDAEPPKPAAMESQYPLPAAGMPSASPSAATQPPAIQQPSVPAAIEPRPGSPPAVTPRPVAPAAAPPPELLIPGMLAPGPLISKSPAEMSSPSEADSSAPKAPIPRSPASGALVPDVLIPGMMAPAPPAAESPVSPQAAMIPPAPAPVPPASEPPAPAVSAMAQAALNEFEEEFVSQKAKAVAKLAEKAAPKPGAKAAAKPGTPGLARRDFRLKVRDDADGYKYIEGNGLAVITEACRVANIQIDELARTLELSRPGLVLILNGRDPISTELLKTLRRLVLRTGGLA